METEGVHLDIQFSTVYLSKPQRLIPVPRDTLINAYSDQLGFGANRLDHL